MSIRLLEPGADAATMSTTGSEWRTAMRGLILAFSSLHLAVLVGCVATPPKGVNLQRLPDVPDGYANIYFIRRSSDPWPQFWPAVLLNGERAAPLPQDTFSVVAVKPGRYAVTMQKTQSWDRAWVGEADISVEAGRSYYLKLEFKYRVNILRECGGSNGNIDCWWHDNSVVTGEYWSEIEAQRALALLQRESQYGLQFVEPFNAKLPLSGAGTTGGGR